VARSDRGLRGWLLATGAIYALGAADFLARPAAATRSLNRYGGERIEDEPGGFYNSLAGAYMATIAALALESARNPAARPDLIPPLLVAKAVSSAAFLYRFVQTRRRGFAVAAALDAGLFAVTAGLYSRSE